MKEQFDLKSQYNFCKEDQLTHRYITNNHIEPLLKNLDSRFILNVIGYSIKKLPIYAVKVGTGSKKILMWSQMHGNETTTTKALFDLFNFFQIEGNDILEKCTLYVIPILNPDGAKYYTRTNYNNIDLNRDANDLTQIESQILREVFDAFTPDFCFNLHDQRTIFSAGNTNNPATVSFLAPAQDVKCTITATRKKAMKIIIAMNNSLQKHIPNRVGRYDDNFNINCVGDTFQSKNVPTILFEAGHSTNDYSRDEVRKYIFLSILTALSVISDNNDIGKNYLEYFDIPENEKLFFDIIIRDAKIIINQEERILDIAIQYEEVLKDNKIQFLPKIKDFGDLSKFYTHKTINANTQHVKLANESELKIGNEIDFVLINNKKYLLKVINN